MKRVSVLAILAACAAAWSAAPAAAAPRPFARQLGARQKAVAHTQAPTTRAILRALRHAPVRSSGASRRRRRADLIQELAARWPRLRGSERRGAARYLARPTDGTADPQQNGYTVPEDPRSPFCSAHYCVHWVPTTPDAPDLSDGNGNGIPDHVEKVASVAETAFATENGTLGWRTPKSDGALGGGAPDHTDIYLAQLGGTGVYGYTAPDPTQPRGNSLFAYLVIDNDFAPSEFRGYASPDLPLDVTLAHEYNHVLHFTYDALEDTWMFESTAVWMEDQVFTDINDYLQYLPGWVQLTSQPITRFNGSDPNDRSNVKVYGSAVWNHWLKARHGPDTVRASWERSVAAKSFAPGAFDAGIRANGGRGFFDEFSRFSTATAEWEAQNSGFPEGASYPDVVRAGSLGVDDGGGAITLDHTAYAVVGVAAGSARRVRLGARVPSGTASAIALVTRTGPQVGGTQTTHLRELPRGGLGSVTLASPAQFTRVSAVLTNADVSNSGFDNQAGDWRFKNDGQRFEAVVSTDFTRPRVTGTTPRAGASGLAPDTSIKVRFSERMSGITRRTLQLIGPGGRAASATVSFRAGGRSATLRPRRLRRGARYRLRFTSSLSDIALNPLRRPPAVAFRTAR